MKKKTSFLKTIKKPQMRQVHFKTVLGSVLSVTDIRLIIWAAICHILTRKLTAFPERRLVYILSVRCWLICTPKSMPESEPRESWIKVAEC